MMILKTSDLASAVNGELIGLDISAERKWYSDSRDVEKGGAFVAIKGASVDGHCYIKQAVSNGAALVIINREEKENIGLEEYKNVTFIAVSDTVKAMSDMAKFVLGAVSPKVIGITGSVGKTTTRELLVSILKKCVRVHAAIRSFNTVIGCSLTILGMPYDTEVLVLEFGTNHHGEIREMVGYFPPEIAVITEVVPAHLEGFGSIEGVLKAKLEICESEKLKKLIYNADNRLLSQAVESSFAGLEKYAVGEKGSFLRIIDSGISLEEKGPQLKVAYSFGDSAVSMKAPLFGKQHAYNVAYAVSAALLAGCPLSDIISSLEKSEPVSGRGVCSKTSSGLWLIDESYNANPASMGAAIDNTVSVNNNGEFELFAVLAGMRELGEASSKLHKQVSEAFGPFRRVYLLGDEWDEVNAAENTEKFASIEEILSHLSEDIKNIKNGIILVKGSNSYGLKKVVSVLTESE